MLFTVQRGSRLDEVNIPYGTISQNEISLCDPKSPENYYKFSYNHTMTYGSFSDGGDKNFLFF